MAEPIRVLHVFGVLDRGGAEGLVMDLYRNLDRNKIQFDFVVHSEKQGVYEPEIDGLGGKVYRGIPLYRLVNYTAYQKAWDRFFREHPYRIVHIHTINSAVPILHAAKKMKVPSLICHAHMPNDFNVIKKFLVVINRAYIRKSTHYRIAASNDSGAYYYGKGSPYQVVRNPVNISRFYYDEAVRQKTRKSLGIDDSEFAFVNVGRFNTEKNHKFLLNVFKGVTRTLPNARLFLVGDGELRPRIERQIARLGLSGQVVLLGVRDDVPALLQAFDLMLFPSLYEGLGNVVVEAQAAGLPSLVSDTVPREAYVINDLVCGLPISKGIKPWADAIMGIINQKQPRRNTREEMRASGFDVKELTGWYESFYLKTQE